MNKLWLHLGLLLVFFVGVSFAEDSSLVELAKKEKERRAKVKATKTFTNKDVEEYIAKHKTPGAVLETTTEGEVAEGQQGEGEQPAQDLSRNEEYWKEKTKSTSDRVDEAQKKLNELQSDVNALNRLWYQGRNDDQRRDIENSRRGRLEDLETAKKELEEAKQARENLEDEARKEGAPPGWVRQEEEEPQQQQQ